MSKATVFETIFITVGTTDFDDLIRALDTSEFLSFMTKSRCKRVIFQIGRGSFTPTYLEGISQNSGQFRLECFRFKPSLADIMAESSLIISHAGSGSMSEALYLRKVLVVCINESLMDNHQVELAEVLAEQKYCTYTKPMHICKYLNHNAEEEFRHLKVYPTADPEVFADFLDEVMGWNEKDKTN